MAYHKEVFVDPKVLKQKTQEFVRRMQPFVKKKLILSFSCGKDSIVLADLLLSNGIEPHMIHYYMIPDLSFDEEIMQYFEKKYGVKVERIEKYVIPSMLANDMYCINRVWSVSEAPAIPKRVDEKMLRTNYEYDFNMLGVKMYDSPIRVITMRKYGWVRPEKKQLFPIFDWKDRDVWQYMTYHGLPVNKTYKWFGRSMDIIRADYMMKLRHYDPESYGKFLQKLPLLDALEWLANKNNLWNVQQLKKTAKRA